MSVLDGAYANLYKIRTDGSERTNLNEEECTYVNVIMTMGAITVFFENHFDSSRYSSYHGVEYLDNTIYVQDIGNLGAERADGLSYALSLEVQGGRFLNVVGEWAYYMTSTTVHANFTEPGALYKIRVDHLGRDIIRIRDGEFLFLNVVDDWIYFSNYNDSMRLYKIKTDGTGFTKLNDDDSYCINVFDDWVYYTNGDENNSLYKIRIDGTERTRLNDNNTARINVVDDWVFFIDGDENALYRVRMDGSGLHVVE